MEGDIKTMDLYQMRLLLQTFCIRRIWLSGDDLESTLIGWSRLAIRLLMKSTIPIANS